jgi:hypothetical protein
MTPAVLRHEGREHRANGPRSLLRARGEYEHFAWRFAFETRDIKVHGSISANARDFVGLAYDNPPGGVKQCLNTKIATCTLTVEHTSGADRGRAEEFVATRRAAFEILTDDRGHGIRMLA